VTAAAPSLQYLTQLVRGDQASLQQATAPQTQALQEQFGAIRKMISAQPRGGGKAGALAESPFQEATAKTLMQSQARLGATQQLSQLATNLAGLGLSESQLGEVMMGLAQTGALTMRGQDVEEHGQMMKMFGDLGQAIGGIIGAGM
jgi:hypothetical protein